MIRIKNASLFYAALYLALIPAFAAAYCALPYHFYHSTAQYEPSLSKDRIKLQGVLQKLLARAIAPTATNARITRVRGLAITDEEIKIATEIVFYLEAFDRSGRRRIEHGTTVTTFYFLSIRTNEAFNIDADPQHPIQVTVRRYPPHRTLEQEPKLQELLPMKVGFGSGCGDDCGFLDLPWTVRNQLLAFARAKYGFPSAATGNFERMLYLSAMTATTVGYGDVVPITRPARLLVATEAVLEVVIIGLFLNSLATRIASAKGDDAAAGVG